MTRAYYADSYTTRFDAAVIAATEVDGRPAVLLDRSYFYPTSGGQPHDTGQLAGHGAAARVIDVVEGEDGAVRHVLDAPLPPGPVAAAIDWPRRFDHMQHHTGQHILSAAFVRVAGAETIGFHLSPQSVTIDLDRADLAPAVIDAAEALACDIVWDDRPVTAREVSAAEAAALPLRKRPPARDGRLRLIDIAEFDLTACGGTHVARAGEVGLIKIVKTERRAGATRVEFLCGGRALADYRAKHDVTRGLVAALTTAPDDLLPSVTRLQGEIKELRAELRLREEALLRQEAERLLAGAEALPGGRLVTAVFADRDVPEVKRLANLLGEAGGVIALLGLAGERAQLIFCRSADAPGHMGDLLKPALAALGEARGGGSPAFAQGGGPPADEAAIQRALDTAVAALG